MAQREIDQLERLPLNSLSEYIWKIDNKELWIAKKHEIKKIEGMKLRAKITKFDVGEPKIAHLSRLENMSGKKIQYIPSMMNKML